MTSFRRRVELKAGPAVVLLHRLPRIVPFAITALLLLGGLGLRGTGGAVLLLLLATVLGTLLLLSWPALQPQARVLRVATLALLVGAAVNYLRT